MNKSEKTVSEKVFELDEKWEGGVYLSYYPGGMGPDDLPFMVSNTTDEGLPVGVEETYASGATLSEALDKALDGDTWNWADDWDDM